jgi:electron transport complex protein RnfC
VREPASERATAPELPCIRCGECAPACPAQLEPYALLRHARNEQLERARAEGLFACTECGRCDRVCPSHIPLLDHFLWAKSELQADDQARAIADAARERFESRRARLVREEIERTARESTKREQASSSTAVQAALERARARKRGKDVE